MKDKVERDENDFNRSDFKEKINILKDHLPKILVENRNLYGILSKGIHELEEEECLEIFPLVNMGIELILDDVLAEKNKIEKEKKFSIFIANKTGDLRNR